MSWLVNMGVVLARTSQGLIVQPVLPTMKAHGCHLTHDTIIPRATLGPGSLLASGSLWELAEPCSEREPWAVRPPADAGRAAWTVGRLPGICWLSPGLHGQPGPCSQMSAHKLPLWPARPLNPAVTFATCGFGSYSRRSWTVLERR